LQINVPDKPDYSKSELFDYLIPLVKPPFSRKGSYFYNECKKNYDSSFTKDTFCIHPTIIPFLTATELSDTHMKRAISDKEMAGELITEGSKEDIKLQPFIAPVNHNTLTSAKTMNIVHTLMGNFCHGDNDKISQMEDMGNNACFLMGYHDKVRFE
jgi:hypothetical protein